MSNGTKIFLAAGEVSGDRYGALLVGELRRLAPTARISGIGGPRMAAAGMCCHLDMTAHATVGVAGAVANLPTFAALYRAAIRHLTAERPHVFVPIDNPGFNLRLVHRARELAIPVCYYVSPQVWAWGGWRLRQIAAVVNRVLVILPFEEELYSKVGVDARYVGHPMLDYLATASLDHACIERLRSWAGTANVGEGEAGGKTDSCPQGSRPLLVGLMPGSRAREVSRVFVPIARAAAIVARRKPTICFAVACAQKEHVEVVRHILEKAGMPLARCEILAGRTFEVMAASDICVAVSGTVTLELAFFRCPTVIVYRTGALGRPLRRLLIRTRHIGLPNIIAGREITPEFLLFDDDPTPVARAALALLEDPVRHAACRAGLEAVMRQLGGPGASARAAQAVLDLVGQWRHPTATAPPPA